MSDKPEMAEAPDAETLDIMADMRAAVQAAREAEEEGVEVPEELHEESIEEDVEDLDDEDLDDEVVDEDAEDLEAVYAELSDFEKEQWDKGWRPEHLYKGEGKWRDADDYADRGSFFDKINDQNRTIKSQVQKIQALEKAMKTVIELNKTMHGKGVSQEKSQIEALRKEAFEMSDLEEFEKYDRMLKELDQKGEVYADITKSLDGDMELPEEEDQPQVEVPQFFQDWERDNTWYNSDTVAQAAFNTKLKAEFAALGTEGTDMERAEAATVAATKYIKKRFPEYFRNPNRSKPAAVGGTNSTVSSKAKSKTRQQTVTKRSLSKAERQVMARMIESTGISEEEYLAAYSKM